MLSFENMVGEEVAFACVGAWVLFAEGTEGVCVSFTAGVGCNVSFTVGELVGDWVSLTGVGCNVSFTAGEVVGDWVSSTVGELVGDWVSLGEVGASEEGASVGASHDPS